MGVINLKSNKFAKLLSDAKVYWKQPMPGRYMPFKEVFAYSFGGIGMYFLIYCVQQLMLSSTNVYIGSAIGISPNFMYILYAISIVVSFPATALRASIIDNARSKQGKYRPYMLYMAFPTALLVIGMVYTPYEQIKEAFSNTTPLIGNISNGELVNGALVLLFNIGFQFFYSFFYDSYENLIMVLSPDTKERSDVLAIKSIVYSLAPSIATALIPLFANWFYNGNMYDLWLFRVLYPPFAIIGILCAVYVFANTQEKIIQAKTHVIRIKFMDAIRSVAKNKLFWVISLAGWVGFLETTYGNMLQWCFQYHNENGVSAEVFTVVQLFVSNANLWGMLAAPFAIRKWGKKKVLIVTNMVNACFLALLWPVVEAEPAKMVLYIAAVLFGNYLMTSFGVILTPAVNADIRDYQQYLTGERIDGMFATVGLIGTVITLGTSGIVPALYERLGINQAKVDELAPQILQLTGDRFESISEITQSPYNVLYINDIFQNVFAVIVLLSVIGAVLNFIPYFFYDMTELRQRSIVKVLQLRAMFEDYGNGVLNDKDIVSTIDMIEESSMFAEATPKDVKAMKHAIKQQKTKAEKKAARKEYHAAVVYNENIEISKFVMTEMNKFSTPEWQFKLEEAKKLYAAGLSGLTSDTLEYLNDVLARAKAMPKKTKLEKEERSAAITSAKNRIYSKKVIEEKHGGKIEEFDVSIFESLFERDDKNLEDRTALEEQISLAKKAKDKAKVNELKQQLAALKAEKKVIDADIKKATDENSRYNRLAKPYVDAKKLIAQAENYTHYEEIKAMYEEAKARNEEAMRQEEAKAKALEAEQKAMKEKLKAEKALKKSEKKNNKKNK